MDVIQVYAGAGAVLIGAALGFVLAGIIRSGGKYDLTYSSLLSDNAGYALFRPWREHRIFACNTLRVPYFDDSPFHPDRMLSDMVNIFYHRAAKPHMYYFSPLRP